MGARCTALRSILVTSVAIALLAVATPLPAADECTITLYGTAHGSSPSTLYVIDPPSGAAFPVGAIGFFNVGAIAFHPVTGLFYGGTSTGDLITIDTATGTGTLVGPMITTSTNFRLKDLSARKSDGTLFLISNEFNALYTLNIQTGFATLIGVLSAVRAAGNGMSFDLQDTLFQSDNATPLGEDGTLYTIDTLTGLSTPLLPITYIGFPLFNTPRINAIDVEPVTGVLYVSVNDGFEGSGPNYLATLDPATGDVTHIGRSVNGLDGLAWGNDCDDGNPCTIDECGLATTELAMFGATHVGPDGLSELYALDPASGISTLIGPIGFARVSGLAFAADGTLFATGEHLDGTKTHALLRIDPVSGVGTVVGPTDVLSRGFGDTISDISFRRVDGRLYGYLGEGGGVGLIDPLTGKIAALGPAYGGGCCGNGIAFDSDGILLHANDRDLGTLDRVSGRATSRAPLSFAGFPEFATPIINAMDVDPDTGTVFVSVVDEGPPETYHLATLDPATGIVTPIGPAAFGLDALAVRRFADNTCTHTPAADSDGDGLCDALDNCPGDSNPGQENGDADGAGDICDNCPVDTNLDQSDRDGDGQGDVCDPCQNDPTDIDTDGDGICDDGDGSSLPGDVPCLPDSNAGDLCDDNCPGNVNGFQTDTDGDGFGDVCDLCTDSDDDGFGDPAFALNTCPPDNCPGDAMRLVNGDFESLGLSGWTSDIVSASHNVDWFFSRVGAGAFPGTPTAPNERGGLRYVASGMLFDDEAILAFSQVFTVPAEATEVRLSYEMYVNDWSLTGPIINPAGLDHTLGPNVHGRVDILSAGAAPFDTGAGVVANYYIGIDPGTLPNPYTTYEFDITGDVAPGATYVLRFAVVTTDGPLNLGFDNARIIAEVGQIDADGDGVGDLCDCAPLDPAAGRPGAITDLMFTNSVEWSWSPPPAADLHHVTRGLLSSLLLGEYGPCLTSTAGPPLVADGDLPPLGDGFIYLFQGEDASCGGLGSLGHTMLGDWPLAPPDAERVNLDLLACP